LLRPDPQRVDRWLDRMAETSAGRVGASAPVWIATGTADETVAPSWQQAYVDAATALGTEVTHRAYDGEDHVGVVFAAREDACSVLLDRLDA
jgi:acetyl esterase/lipase